jgi:hypothetical protein
MINVGRDAIEFHRPIVGAAIHNYFTTQQEPRPQSVLKSWHRGPGPACNSNGGDPEPAALPNVDMAQLSVSPLTLVHCWPRILIGETRHAYCVSGILFRKRPAWKRPGCRAQHEGTDRHFSATFVAYRCLKTAKNGRCYTNVASVTPVSQIYDMILNACVTS